MRLRSLHVENFRGFSDAHLHLHEDVTLLVGVNGTGKTALLDALAIGLGAWVSALTQAPDDRPIQASDAHLHRQDGAGLATANAAWPVRLTLAADLPGPHAAARLFSSASTWTRERSGPRARTATSPASLREAARALSVASAQDPDAPLPLLAYYGTMRLWVQKRDKQDRLKHLTARAGGYAACLEAATDQALFERWMARRTQDHIQRLDAAGAPVPRPHLDAVEAAAVAVLEGAQRFRFKVNQDCLWVEFRDGRGLPFQQLSDGQRSLLLLATDIAWRCCQLNPQWGAQAPQKTDGVVLIDEIELHLHPQWQRQVIPALRAAFPRLQLVISTHSPQVVSTARPDWLRVLEPDGQTRGVPHTEGRDTNALLRDVFAVTERPPATVGRLDAVEALLATGDVEAARTALRTLEAQLGPGDARVQGLWWELGMATAAEATDA